MITIFEGITGNTNAAPNALVSAWGKDARFYFRIRGTFTGFTIKAGARILGDNADNFSQTLAIRNETSGALVAGGTGVTAAGLYSVDAAGNEIQMQATVVTPTGSLTLTGHVAE